MDEAPTDASGDRSATHTPDTMGPGFSKLEHFGLLQFSGADAQPFLHAQFSCDVNGLAAARAQYGSYNTPKGRMFASFLLWHGDTAYTMQLPRALCAPVCKRLSMYVLRSKVEVRDVSNDFCLYGVAGADAEALLTPLGAAIPSAPLSMTSANRLAVLRLDAYRLQIIAPAGRTSELHTALGKNFMPMRPAAWDLLNIRAGIPFITPATQDEFVPQMANLDLIGGVSFSKGCYPGQEIVARMHYLGKLKQRMYLANVSGDAAPQPGDKLYSADTGEQATGMIMNAAPAPEGGFDVLAVSHIASVAGGDVHLKSPGGPPLKFMPLPYKIPS